jgi:uncharacterized protein
MKILIYLGHPAQYHFFKNSIRNLRTQNHSIQLLLKTKDVLEDLLKNDKENYINILPEGRVSSNTGILLGLIKRDFRLFKIVREFKPNIMLGTDPSLAHIGKILNIPVLTVLEDDHFVIPKLAKLTFPFTSGIIAPDTCDCGKWNNKKISYSGFMKLAYLHPNYFTKQSESTAKNFLIRLSKLDAHHDFRIKGFTSEILLKLINVLLKFGEVKLIAEAKLDPEFQKYLLVINPSEIHNYLSKVTLLVSDSQSMSMEAAMLGIPSIRFSDFAGRIGVLEELEHKYKLTFGIKTKNHEKLFEKLNELLKMDNLQEAFEIRRQQMLKEKIDVTAFFIWLINNYPSSVKAIKDNPSIQYQFR